MMFERRFCFVVKEFKSICNFVRQIWKSVAEVCAHFVFRNANLCCVLQTWESCSYKVVYVVFYSHENNNVCKIVCVVFYSDGDNESTDEEESVVVDKFGNTICVNKRQRSREKDVPNEETDITETLGSSFSINKPDSKCTTDNTCGWENRNVVFFVLNLFDFVHRLN